MKNIVLVLSIPILLHKKMDNFQEMISKKKIKLFIPACPDSKEVIFIINRKIQLELFFAFFQPPHISCCVS